MDADQATFAQVYLAPPRPRLVRHPDWTEWWIGRTNSPTHFDLFNQNWNVQLVPATARAVPAIVQSVPPGSGIRPQNLGGIGVETFRRLNTH
jgi:hypothetical protein